MQSIDSYDLLTRIARLMAHVERGGSDLQPVQLHALAYLERANRYSDTPAAATEYLEVTKGTASQTLRALRKKGLLQATPDTKDRRVIHLALTPAGKKAIRSALPPELFTHSLEQLSSAERQSLEDGLLALLRSLQQANSRRLFGICGTCRHLQTTGNRHRCGLTLEPLSVRETELLCREHEISSGASSNSASSSGAS